MMTRWILGSLLLVASAQASEPAKRVVLGQGAFQAAPTGPAQGFKPAAPPAAQEPLKPLVDPEVDGIVGLVSFEQLRDIIARTAAPEDRRMLQRAFDKLLLLERDRRTYARSINLLVEGCGRMIDRVESRK